VTTSVVGRARFRVGVTRERLVEAWRFRPPRLREPLFSPERELARIAERRRRVDADPSFELLDYETHQPVLLDLLEHLPDARMIELGTGYASTPIVLGRTGASLSLETEPVWYRRFRRYASDAHRLELVRDFDEREWQSDHLRAEWDVALVDNSPGTSRQRNLLALGERTRFVVCHDTQECFRPAASRFGWDFSSFGHVFTYTRFATYTTVVSNHEPIPLGHLPGVLGPPPRSGGGA